jgi:PAS domain S-box-containing protein
MTDHFPGDLCSLLVVGAADAILFADREGIIRLWNAGAESMFGYPASEAVGQSLDLIIGERLRPRHWEGWEKVMRTGNTRYGARDLLAVPARRCDGTQISCEFTISLVRGEDGLPLGVGAILRDVTARRKEEKALKDRLAELEKVAAGA